MSKAGYREILRLGVYAHKIISFTEDETYDSFIHPSSVKIQYAVAWSYLQLSLLAEKILKRHKWIAVKYPELNLEAWKGMGNFLKNCYEMPDLTILWDTVENEIVPLYETLKEVVRSER